MAEDINRSIIDRLGRIMRCFRRSRGVERWGEMTFLQVQAIMFIKHHPDTKMSDLSEALGLSASSASLLIDRLVAAGKVERIADEHDRRVVYLRLRPFLKRHFERNMKLRFQHLNSLLNELSEHDRAELDRILSQIEEKL